MSRKKIVAGNWKMNLSLTEGENLIKEIAMNNSTLPEDVSVVIAPPYLHLSNAVALLKGKEGFTVAAQNCHQSVSGAFTGEVSAEMLKSAGVDSVILGHSERRQYNCESDKLLASKTNAALQAGLNVIFCVGEPLEVREAGTQNEFVKSQIENGLFHLTDNEFKNIVLAYEPIWAIGTGKTATSQQAQDMHAHIRNVIAQKYDNEIANQTSILYGGSCKPDNAAELFACPDVDGGLIGGAALKEKDFSAIIAAR